MSATESIISVIQISENKTLTYFSVDPAKQVERALAVKYQNGLLLTEWVASDGLDQSIQWYTLYLLPDKGLYCFQSTLNSQYPIIYDLSHIFPVCNRLQRAIYDLTRITTKLAKDKRAWLNHGYFPLGILNKKTKMSKKIGYAFKKVTGQGVHEIPVGPVHAGIIEPGHFRFSVVGERILKLEQRLGYTHKGIHRLFIDSALADAIKLVGRISGDSTVAYASAFAMACEQIYSYQPDESIRIERVILLERERLCNHIGDIGAIINDAGMPSLQASFLCIKERLLRVHEQCFGHRYLMDTIKPFATMTQASKEQNEMQKIELMAIKNELHDLEEIVSHHFGLQDRFDNTGMITQRQAHDLGLLGVAAKASGIDHDLRHVFKNNLYSSALITVCDTHTGDVTARVAVRFKELFESIKIILSVIDKLHDVQIANNNSIKLTRNGMGIGVVEAWRGPITVVVKLQQEKVQWCHFHDPSWQNWLALEYAVMNNIVADFPLINKSFNLSYSGHDS